MQNKFLVSSQHSASNLYLVFSLLAVFTISLMAETIVIDTIHAQESSSNYFGTNETSSDASNLFKNDVYVWAPTKMIKGETYEGLVVLPDAATNGKLVLVTASDKTVLDVPESITVLPESNHGIFEIKALKEGGAKIFVSVNGEVTTADVRVHSSSSKPDRLGLFLPSNSTKAAKVPVYIFTLDGNGSPAIAKQDNDVIVNLSSSSEMIKVPESVTIQNHTYYTRFTAEVNGDGTITASAPNLKPDATQITRKQDNADVLMGIAPNIALQDSKVFYYVWLEKDGKPFKPSHVVDVFLSSDDPEVARLAPRITSPHYGDSTVQVRMVDGIARGTLFTGERGSATISASVAGFGHVKADLVVGPVVFSNDQTLPNEFQQGSPSIQQGNVTASSSSRIDAIYQPNVALSWIFPAKTSDKAYGVAALYWQNTTKSVKTTMDASNGTKVQSVLSTQTLIPLQLDDRTITVASQEGLDHKTMYKMSTSSILESTEGKGRLSAVEFELAAAKQGDYTVSVSGAGLDTSQAKLSVVPEHTESYRIGILSLPSRPDILQDLAVVSILDKEGSLVGSGIAQGNGIEIIPSKIQVDREYRHGQSASTIVAGKVSEHASIVASGTNLGTATADIIPAGVSTAIEFELPKTIHVGEAVPYVVHEVDAFGTPLEKITPIGMSTTVGVGNDEDYQYLTVRNEGQGKVAAISDFGAGTKTFEAFSNEMNVEIVLDKEEVRVGEEIVLTVISDVPNLEIEIDSPIVFDETKENNEDGKGTSFFAIPDREGTFAVTVTAQKDGYTPVTRSATFDAVKLFDLTVNAVSIQDNNSLSTKHSLIISNQTINEISTPYTKELGQSEITVSFPSEQEIGNRNYSLKKIQTGNEEFFNKSKMEFFLDSNIQITAYYERTVRIDVSGAKGSGFYPYGQTVTLSVPPKDKVSFLVREVFDSWDGLPYETEPISFNATEDISASVVYRDDYSFLMLLVAAIATTGFYMTVIRKKINLRWEISKLVDLLKNKLQANPSKV